jgi:hypothetical protein
MLINLPSEFILAMINRYILCFVNLRLSECYGRDYMTFSLET